MRKVRVNYSYLTQSEFNEFLTYTTQCLTNNDNFTDLPESLVSITAKREEWQKALGLSK